MSRLPLPLLYWHLLSLDAPTVACVWAWLLAYAADRRPSLSATLVLGLGTWGLYVTDRLLDAFHEFDPLLLRERHRFTRRHCRRFLAVGLVVGVVLAWLISVQLSERARTEDAVLFASAMIYFAAVHGSKTRSPGWLSRCVPHGLLPKELAVALLFAAATAVPALSPAPFTTAQGWSLAGTTFVFCGVCWLNCIAIEYWETNGPDDKRKAGTLRHWRGERLMILSGALAAGALIIAPVLLIVPQRRPLAAVLLSAAASALIIFILDRRASRLGQIQLRIAADLALLTPVAFLPFLK